MKKQIILALFAAACTCSASAAVAPYDGEAMRAAAMADVQNWMKYLPDDMFVAHLSIPGTHDTATAEGWDSATGSTMSTTQAKTIDEQLAAGIRAFDFRPGLEGSGNSQYLNCNHGSDATKLKLADAFKKLTDYLDAHPTEFFIIHLFRGNVYSTDPGFPTNVVMKYKDADKQKYNELFNEIFNQGWFHDYIVDYSPYLKVKDMRGKIVVFRRDRIDFAHITKAGNLYNWPSDEVAWSESNITNVVNASNPAITGKVYATDISSPDNETTLNVELESLTNLYTYNCNQTRPNDVAEPEKYKPTWSMIFTSGAYGGENTAGYLKNAEYTNPHFTTLVRNQHGPTGAVFSDWVLTDTHKYSTKTYNTKGVDLVSAIIENNFYYAADYILDSEKFAHDPSFEVDLFGGKTSLLRNVGTGLLLDAGADWGTHATLSSTGICVTPSYNPENNAYAFQTTFRQGNANNFLGPDFFIDNGTSREFNAEYSGQGNRYYLTYDDNGTKKAMTATPTSGWIDGTEYLVDGANLEKDNLMQQWEIISTEDYLAEIAAVANPDNGQNMTFTIKANKFDPNDGNNDSAWQFTNINGKYLGNSYVSGAIKTASDAWNDRTLIYRVESKDIGITVGKYSEWKLNQNVSGLPNGKYSVSCHMFAVGGNSTKLVVNGAEVAPHFESAIPSDAAALEILRNNSTLATLNDIIVTDGTLSIEFNKLESNKSSTAFFFSDITLTYYGPADMIAVEYTPSDVYDTIILPFDAEVPEGLTVSNSYIYREQNAAHYVINQTMRERIAANTPYIVGCEQDAIGKTLKFWGVPEASTGTYTLGLLTGTLSDTALDDVFTLERVDNGEYMAFVRKASATVPAYHACLLDRNDEGINAPGSAIEHVYIGGPDTETIEVTPTGFYSTMMLPFDAEIPEGMRVFTAARVLAKGYNGKDEWLLELTQIDAIEANKPYVYTAEMTGSPSQAARRRSAGAKTFVFTGIPTNDNDTYTNGLLTGTHVERAAATGDFIFKPDMDGSVFSRVKDGESHTVPAHQAYIAATEESTTVEHMLLDDYLTSTGTKLTLIPADATVDVYSTSGIALRRGVRADEASAGLAPGFYLLRSAAGISKIAVR